MPTPESDLNRFIAIKLPFLLLTAIMATISGVAQAEFQSRGQYFVTNYSPADYGAGTQNWEMVQDSKGRLIAANRDGVLVYDGFRWDLIPLPISTPLRSLAITAEDRIYVGAVGQFGYLQADSVGVLQFQSLSEDFEQTIGDVWETYVTHEGVVFATRTAIYVCSGNTCQKIQPDYSISRTFLLHGSVFVSVPGQGVGVVRNGGIDVIIDQETFGGDMVFTMLERGDDTVYLIKRNREVYALSLSDGSAEQLRDADGRPVLVPAETYRATRLRNGNYAFATISSGVHITDARLQPLEQIDRESGLRVSMVLNVFEDRDGAIWALLNNGISRIDNPQYVRYWNEDTGVDGTVLNLSSYNNQLVAATSSGVYLGNPSSLSMELNRLNEVSTQVWQTETIEVEGRSYLLVGGNDQLSYWDGREYRTLAAENVRSFYASKQTPGRVYFGYLQGWGFKDLEVDSAGRLRIVREAIYLDPPFEMRGIFEDVRGDIWLLARFNGIFMVQADFESAEEPEVTSFTYDWADPAEETVVMGMHPAGDTLLFSGDTGFAQLNLAEQKFTAHDPAFDPLFHERIVMDVFPVEMGRTLVLFNDGYAVMNQENDGSWQVLYESGRDIPEASFYAIAQIGSHIWVGGSEGLYRYAMDNRPTKRADFQAVIGSVIIGQDSLIYGGFSEQETLLDLHYGRYQVELHFGAARFHRYAPLTFESKLEGFDEQWTATTSDPRRIYTNLPDGTYRFRVRATDMYGNVSAEDTIQIRVATPWFKSWWAYLLYALGSAGLMVALIRLRTRSVVRKNRELEILIARHTASIQVEKRRLEIINEDLRTQDEHREKFLSVVAHDLRNPLMIIRSSAELVEDPENTREEILELTGFIRDAADRMQDIIETLLEDRAKKIRSEVGEGTRVKVDTLIRKIVHEFKPWSDKKSISVEVQPLEDELYMNSDAAVAGVIISNLLSNALKYSHSGTTVRIHASRKDAFLVLAVQDQGQGLTPADLRDVGKPFKKLSARPTDGESSSGLGLHIVKDLIEGLGGRLLVFSEGAGKGSRFEVHFPAAHHEPEAS